MSTTAIPSLRCGDEDARLGLIAATDSLHGLNVQGIDYLEVSANQLQLDVHFVQKNTSAGRTDLRNMLNDLVSAPENVRISGGERVRQIAVVKVRRLGLRLIVTVDQRGDFSTYTLSLTHAALDPAFASIEFSFKAGCPSRFDCRGGCTCVEPAPAPPAIDYMAKDFDSFRQALIDRLPSVAPQWLERNEADLGMMLIELLAYAGDQLSYLQDAVANEAYLDSARQRISVRRHARLLDYYIGEGASARAFVVAAVSATCTIAAGTQLLTRRNLPFEGALPPLGPVLAPPTAQVADQARTDAAAVFETIADASLDPLLSPITIHLWDLEDCCLPVGTTTADLEGDLCFHPEDPGRQDPWRLWAGSFLVLEETAGVATGLPGDADPTHRQVVRLTAASPVTDPFATGPLTRVQWADDDALTFPLCLTWRDAQKQVHPIAVAHGNILVADHGELRDQWWPVEPVPPASGGPPPGGLVRGSRPTTFLLEEGPPSAWRPLGDGPVATMIAARAQMSIWLDVIDSTGNSLSYQPADDLIGAASDAQQFVPEVTNDGRASIRFGDGTNGLAPTDDSFVHAHYRVGRGLVGNVGAEAIAHILLDPLAIAIPPVTLLRNPVPAAGGVDPETVSQVKVRAPVAFRSPQERAVTEADYAEVAMRYPGIAHAVARFRWTGSWLTVYLILDPVDRNAFDDGLVEDVESFVQLYTQAGYDLDVQPPSYVPLDIELFICVAPDRFRTDVEASVLSALSSGPLPAGGQGFFSAQSFGFGQPLYLSALYAAVAAVPGVVSVAATRFSRYYDDDPPPGWPVTTANIAAGLITAGDLEILELANDPSLPERGVLTITSGGGR